MESRDGAEPFAFLVYDGTVRFASTYECIEGCDELEGTQPSTVFIEPEESTEAPRGFVGSADLHVKIDSVELWIGVIETVLTVWSEMDDSFGASVMDMISFRGQAEA